MHRKTTVKHVSRQTTREATILFADLIDSSALSHAFDALRYDELVFGFQRTAVDVLREMEATIRRRLPAESHVEAAVRGDELSLILGSPPPPSTPPNSFSNRAAALVLQVAIRLKRRWLLFDENRHRIESGKPPFGVAIGLHSGPVVVGKHFRFGLGATSLARPAKRETAEGYAINLAKRVETASRMGRWSRVFLTRPIYDATIPDFRQAFVRTDVAALKGLPTPPIIYEAKGIGHFDNKAFPQDADFQSRANVELYEKLVAAEPDELWLVLDLAHKYFDGGDYEGAIRKYKAAIEVDPGFAPAYAYLGRAYFRNYCLGPAAAALRRAVEINPDHARASNFLGVCLRRQALQCHWGEPGHEERGDELLREAVAWHERAIRVSTVEQMRFPWARNALNMTIAESYKRPVQTPYRLPQALLHSRELLEDVDVRAERKEHLVLHTMGVIKLKLKSWDEARAYFRRALGLLEKRQQTDPVSIDAKGFAERKAEILFHWGLCDLGHSGRWDGAQRRWRDAKNAVKQGWGRDWRRVWEEQYWTKRRVSAGQDQSTIDDVVGG